MSVGNLHMLLGSQFVTPAGEIDVISPDSVSTYSVVWRVPRGVFSISAALIGGGGGGAAGARGPYPEIYSSRPPAGGGGGGGGGLSYANNLPVEPDDLITIIVGAGGQGGDYSNSTTELGVTGFNGSLSSIRRNGTTILSAVGGGRGSRPIWIGDPYIFWYGGNGGAGGVGQNGTGGDGGYTAQPFNGQEDYLLTGGSGGGPGGWGGSGGRGRGISQTSSAILEATLGQLGGGAGGGNSGSTASFGAYGSAASWPYLGVGGSIINSTSTPFAPGAGGGGSAGNSGVDGRQGRAGRARIMWNGPGVDRSYPNG